ncbi:FAD-binding oxidoreductase [Kordiimonas aquimaris]|uniref:FAD-binding oxidoreductase n=1 Tax=Kordiimonas aquimaris TaxID=707591 RepID=UPI0021D3C387|nr:FAD-linked oxidase C-terminal domain-containing protein [Kordiimonas aquimaris]
MAYVAAINALRAYFGERIITSDAARQAHGQDESSHAPRLPDAVLYPHTTEAVAQAVKICAAHDMPVIPFGAGTSLEGHVLAVKGGLSIDMTEMNQVLSVNSADLDVRVQTGITRKALNDYIRSDGVFMPVDPGANCTIGGMISTRASGTNAVRYGTMREQVLSLQVVTAAGDIVETGTRARKSAAGYDLTHMFIGAEGTLGIVTEASLKVYGIPETISAGICSFRSVKDAVDTAITSIQMGLPISRIELMDTFSMKAVNAYSKLGYAEQPTLFLEFTGAKVSVSEQIASFRDIAGEFGGSDITFASAQEDINKLWHARHQLYYATKAMAPGKHVVTTDACVPISNLAACMEETRIDLEEAGVTATMLGHVGDGNFHSIILVDPENPIDMQLADDLNARMMRRAINMDGTATGEHGIGIGKQKFLEWEKADTLPLMRSIKTALDPKGIMNPGKIFTP